MYVCVWRYWLLSKCWKLASYSFSHMSWFLHLKPVILSQCVVKFIPSFNVAKEKEIYDLFIILNRTTRMQYGIAAKSLTFDEGG